MNFMNKVVVITGAGSGMGRAMLEEFSNEGAYVIAIGRTASKLQDAISHLKNKDHADFAVVDIGNEQQVAQCILEIENKYGKIDILINNAGVLDLYTATHEMELSAWNDIINTNLTGPFLMSKYCIPSMLKQKKGVILNISSVSAHGAVGDGSAYTASKHGMEGLTRQLCFEYGAKGIRVNSICPGATTTPMSGTWLEDGVDADQEIELSGVPAQRWGKPIEIAKYAAFLASDHATYIQGASCVIDGGWLTGGRDAF